MGRVRNLFGDSPGWPILAGLVYFLAVMISLGLRETDGTVTVWPAGGVLVSALLLGNRQQKIQTLVYVMIANVLGHSLSGVSAYPSIGFTVSHLVGGGVIVWLLGGVDVDQIFASFYKVVRFCAAAMAGAVAGALVIQTWNDQWSIAFFAAWVTTVILGILVVTPLILAIARSGKQLSADEISRRPLEIIAIMALVLGSCLLVIGQEMFPLLFLPVMATLIASVRLGAYGAAVSIAINALVASLAIAWDIGPFHMIQANKAGIIYFAQFYLVTVIASALPLAALVAQRDRMMQQALHDNRLLAMAEKAAKVGHWRLDLRDDSIFWSNEMFNIHGFSPPHIPSFEAVKKLIHPDDYEKVGAKMEACIINCEPYNLLARIIRPDGAIRHIESYGTPEFDRKGKVIALFGAFRDVTDQVTVLEELAAAQLRSERDARQARKLAETDPLTGIASRRKIIDLLKSTLLGARASSKPMAVAILDVDHFKSINDQFGHGFGDVVLKAIADSARQSLRTNDCIGRLGGEEFLIVLPDIDAVQAKNIVEGARLAIESLRFADMPDFRVTASFGIAALKDGADETWMLQAADVALYQSKDLGRNRLSIAA